MTWARELSKQPGAFAGVPRGELVEDLELAARSRLPALITDRNQLLRESFARLIHRHSQTQRGAFVSLSCKTEAAGNGDGCLDVRPTLARAQGGTAFLDDIGEMPSRMQAQLLAFLEQQAVVEAVLDVLGPGDTVRIIAGSAYPLHASIAAGTFSDELFYRLNIIHVTSPP